MRVCKRGHVGEKGRWCTACDREKHRKRHRAGTTAHLLVPGHVHRRLKVWCASRGMTIGQAVELHLAPLLAGIEDPGVPETPREQKERVREYDASRELLDAAF